VWIETQKDDYLKNENVKGNILLEVLEGRTEGV